MKFTLAGLKTAMALSVVGFLLGCSQETAEPESAPATEKAELNRTDEPTKPEPKLVGRVRRENSPGSADESGPGKDFAALAAEAQAGDAAAQVALANYYASGRGGRIDYKQALQWYDAAARQGNTEAQYRLGVMHAKGRGVTPDDSEAVKWFYEAATHGNASAQYEVGKAYAKGLGVASDAAVSKDWYEQAASNGDFMAQIELKRIAVSEGAVLNGDEMLSLFQRAAEQGNAEAQVSIAMMHANKRGAEGQAEAAHWLTRAANQGDPEALHQLARLYQAGTGVSQDQNQAARLLVKAADAGRADSAFEAGQMYATGNGVERNPQEAARLLELAATRNHPGARTRFAAFLEQENNPVDAYRWYLLAASKGDAEAVKSRDSLAARLTPEQLKMANENLPLSK